MKTALRDGSLAPMWGFCDSTAPACAPSATPADLSTLPTWSPGPTIVVPAGSNLTINLTNALPVTTSLVVPGQLGGGLGKPAKMPSPPHSGQSFTTFPGNSAQASPPFVPPAQDPRVRSFGTEVAGAGSATLDWTNLKPGTYLYGTGTMPSLQQPMGLYGVLVVTAPTGTCSVTTATACSVASQCPTGETCNTTSPGAAYPGVSYDDDVALLFSEIDPVQNAAVDAAAVAGADPAKRFNDPSCKPSAPCYPAAINYTPTYFLINGAWFDRTAPQNSAFLVADTAPFTTKNLLVRLLNAGSRTHVPSIVGLPMTLAAEDGNVVPGYPKAPRVQSEVLLTAGKTYDVVVQPPAATSGTAYAPNTYPVFDRALALSTANHPDGGMQGFLIVDHAAAQTLATGTCSLAPTSACGTTSPCAAGNGACVLTPVAGAPGNLPAGITPKANDDTFTIPYNAGGVIAYTPFSGSVTTNDVGIKSVALGTNVTKGTLALAADGTFTYVPNAGTSGADGFTYVGNGTLTANVTLSVQPRTTSVPSVSDKTFTSAFASRFSAPRPGVLARDTSDYPFVATNATPVSGCQAINVNADGSFDVTASASPAPCVFTYQATNSQGNSSATATVTVNFGAASGFPFSVSDASTGSCAKTSAACSPTMPCGSGDTCVGAPVTDYRWTIQEDLTFKHATGATPSPSTRTVATSFHRSHMPVVATGCVGPLSCGSGQQVRLDNGTPGARHVVTDAEALVKQVMPSDVVLDPASHYYISILPGDAGSPPGHAIGGGEIKRNAAGTAWSPVAVSVQPSPLTTAQMSIYIYEDNFPTNGQNEPGEAPLGGFNVILFDPAGRTGDVAGQQTYDAFNMPLSNALLGMQGCPDDRNTATNGTTSSTTGNAVGVVYTCPNDPNAGTPAADPAKYALAGHALIKNLTPARYDVIAHPGAAREGAGEVWWQTETLEGTPAQDAFVGLNEPTYFQEFGPPGPHVTIGFVNPGHLAKAAANGTSATVTGKVTNQHMSRPSSTKLYDAGTYDMFAATTCRVVLNSQAGTGPAVAAAGCDADGSFTLSGIPAGDYDLAVVDEWLDQIIQNVAVSVPKAATTVALGDLPELSWFTQWDQNIFMDRNGNGIYEPYVCSGTTKACWSDADCALPNQAPVAGSCKATSTTDTGISNVPLTVRYRNGAPSNTTLTDTTGNGLLPELFPLFNWYVAEADTTRFKQTGVHIYVDGGGIPDTSGPGANLWTSKYPTGEKSERTETPGAYSYGIQGFISQRSRIEWGRAPYAAGENGGIQGTVVYSSTRPFDDQRFNVQTIWEPLVPRATVNLYQQVTLADGTPTLELLDTTRTTSFDDWVNLVYDLSCGTSPTPTSCAKQYLLGSDGSLRDPATGAIVPGATAGKQVHMTCPGQVPAFSGNLSDWIIQPDPKTSDPFPGYSLVLGDGSIDQFRCYDGFHVWNQVQAAPYDGRYNFPSDAYKAAHPFCSSPSTPACGGTGTGTCACAPGHVTAGCCSPQAPGQTLVSIPQGTYVVEVVTPPGYEVVKEEDKNILIGDAFIAPVTQQFGGLGSIFIIPDQATIGNGNPYNPGTGDPGFQSDPTTNLGTYDASNATTFPECVGNLHRVPDFLSLYPQAQQVAPFAGMDRPLCDRKKVVLADQMQSNANFFVFTETPVASNNTGIILDDASSEFNAVSPDFGEKASVPFVPVSIRDFTGLEIGRTYSDQWGAYNMMTPSSWLVNPPTPSGYGPNMLVTCINDPGPIPDPAGAIDPATGKVKLVNDPAFNPAYSNFCYTNPYMPGQTTYLDTPVVPVAAFASGYNPTDCSYPSGYSSGGQTVTFPAIQRVDTSRGFGPWLPAAGSTDTVTITALGDVPVQNPAYSGPFATSGPISQTTVLRHYGFGTSGTVTVNGIALNCANGWTDQRITCTVPSGVTTGELVVTPTGGPASIDTVTLHIGPASVTRVAGGFTGQTAVGHAGPIQQAIDAAKPGDLILVDAGTYEELVVMWKPVQLQGVGAAATIVNAAKYPTSKLETWRPRINQLFNVDPITGNQTLPSQVDPLPTQEITGGVVVLEPTVLGSEEGAGFTVLAKDPSYFTVNCARQRSSTPFAWDSNFGCYDDRVVTVGGVATQLRHAQIDGFGVTGGDAGGGIYVNGWAHNLEISNNRVYGNAGAFNGGIRVGVPYLETELYPGQSLDANGNVFGTPATRGGHIEGLGYDRNVQIHHNNVSKNGTVEGPGLGGGAGAGISMCTGSDGYSVDHNWVCGNYGQSDGGGIGHLGYSQGGAITNNWILFNQSFQQTGTTSGGGIFVGGEPPVAGTLSLGSGNVTIDRNLVRGNFAEGGHGGGIRLQQVNGADVAAFPSSTQANLWNRAIVTNNTIESNVAGWCGGGISLVDVLSAKVNANTIASNDSTGIAGASLTGGIGHPSPSGICSEHTSAALLGVWAPTATERTTYAISQPSPFAGNTISQNRSFYYAGSDQLCAGNSGNPRPCSGVADQRVTGECTAGAAYWDYGVLGDPSPTGGAIKLNPKGTSTTFPINAYCNGSRIVPELPAVLNPLSLKNLQVAATLDEGNNYVNLRYGPLYVQIPTTTTVKGPTSP
ncbi:MAG TPA: Ig-like domain-containing protein [Anaeromyxobacteraceae bacterium]|nr:Ig-like domain-containing protein [Anaeromyxobacteraceae bacterium]